MKTNQLRLTRIALFWHLWAAVICSPFCPLKAQMTFITATSLPQRPGQFYVSYASTNAEIDAFIAITPSPQKWDFSQMRRPNESILRTEIISPENAQESDSFPNAVYAESDILNDNPIAWRYYEMNPGGRDYDGFVSPTPFNASETAVFIEPTTDLPAVIQFGQKWDRRVSWQSEVLGLPVLNDFACAATVDAFGTVVLERFGELPALRVHEVHVNSQKQIVGGTSVPVNLQTNQYYYFLVEGLGIAAQVLIEGNNAIVPIPLPHTNQLSRVFQADYFKKPRTVESVTALQLQVKRSDVLLDWSIFAGASSYRIESAASITSTNWEVSATTTTNSWKGSVIDATRFYRVFALF